MTQQDTQPPAETLAERLRAAVTYQYMPMAVRKLLSEAAAALTRRAGGDAIPAGMKPWHGGDAPPEDWDSKSGEVLLRNGERVSPEWAKDHCDWQWSPRCSATDDIIAYTPKPPAGGDAGAVGEAEAFRRGAEAMQRKLADALRDHLNSRAAAIANAVAIPEYQA